MSVKVKKNNSFLLITSRLLANSDHCVVYPIFFCRPVTVDTSDLYNSLQTA